MFTSETKTRSSRTKRSNQVGLVGVALLAAMALVPQRAAAQTTVAPDSKPQTFTGCLQRGEEVSDYKLVTQDGTWNLGGASKLKLGPQVNHTVKVTGKITEVFDAKNPSKDADPKMRGILDISKVSTLNATCAP